MKNQIQSFNIPLASLIALLAIQPMVQSAVIYSQTFNDEAGWGYLVGTAPTVGTGTWAGPSIDARLNGMMLSAWGMAALPFTPEAGKVYTLTASFTALPSDVGTARFGFTKGDANQDEFILNNAAAILDYGNNSQAQSWPAPWVDGPGAVGVMKIVLDTTASKWTASYFSNASETTPFNTHTYTTNPTINYVGFGNDSNAGTITAFKLVLSCIN